ncbi:hypothetical protein GQ169_004444, partial [Salmonella enterica]|nr:hypothetical protein [Salmonella enterica]
VWEDNMFTIHNNPNRTTAASDTHVNHANLEDKSTVVTSLTSVKNIPANMLKSKNSSQCVILNNLHVPQDALATDIASYNRGLQARINLEYRPQENTVFLLGTPEVLDTNESLSLPVSPHILTQKLLSISNNKNHEFSVKSNGYVCL